ncbi:uncharacterized protein KY384_003522 [Bacidia gigantensis]|uniref:uncharacterized protein n=1 Tax=Bacidia gigantensis TaxID=2732470 RepID=UPI001D05A634|nr:uncharacterized protein KY384_003522 [Bacidia gigantensis]KAG8531886.1 hypothetical protein KY384_003522 [Bacidia gigantensis]
MVAQGGKAAGFHVLIIGAGSVGLLLAQRLKVLDIPCTVYEREVHLNARGRNWNFGIYWAQAPLAECLPQPVQDAISKAQVKPHAKIDEGATMPILNAETGEVLMRAPTPNVLRLNRARLREVLAQAIDVKYGKRLKSVEKGDDGKGVIATFEDGTTASGNLLVGADGAKSRVRQALLGAERGGLQTLPLMGLRALGTLPAKIALELKNRINADLVVTVHPVGLVAFIAVHDIPDENRPETWVWLFHLTYPYDANRESLTDAIEIRKIWDDFSHKLASPLQDAFLSAAERSTLLTDRLGDWPTVTWDNWGGSVTLAGDAAHPMTYHRGQGLNNAVHDAAYLGRALNSVCYEDKPLEEAIDVYEKEVVERGYAAVVSSTENSMMMVDWEKLKQSPLFKYGLKQGSRA